MIYYVYSVRNKFNFCLVLYIGELKIELNEDVRNVLDINQKYNFTITSKIIYEHAYSVKW